MHYVTIHGHFYQPPRENPWLEVIEVQDSAYPYHDWNQRVTAESYRPNATSRVLGDKGKIARIVNNYSRMSFNFGPTLLDWLKEEAFDVYDAILDADRESIVRFGGHGSAIAQVYNHIIMPLANHRDKVTQVVWGIEDFRHRFCREPEGMWLAETAVDTETLEVLAEHGIKFTILAPRQAQRVREVKHLSASVAPLRVTDTQPSSVTDGAVTEETYEPTGNWHDVSGEWIDTRQAYLCRLPSGRTISLFFYNGGLAKAVAFEGLLKDGVKFADYLLGGLDHNNPKSQLSHIATDGETYGHHHRFGDMALAFALRRIEADPNVNLTNYGQFLELNPPTMEVEIIENSAWSCFHGVERWRSDCGCATGEHPGWNQKWRKPLREALDWLRDEISPKFETRASVLFKDPWQARDRYIHLILERSDTTLSTFLLEETGRELDESESTDALMLMELQRHLLLMYTSCGWFFDDVAGIETSQDLAYAGRAVQLAQMLLGYPIEEQFVAMLEKAVGNKPAIPNGRAVYDDFVLPARVDHTKLAAHYAMTGMFEEQKDVAEIYQYRVKRLNGRNLEAGLSKLSFGFLDVSSLLTSNARQVYFGAVHFSDHNLLCGVNYWQGKEKYQAVCNDLTEAFERADTPEMVRQLDRHFGENIYTLKSLFRDGQRRLLKKLLKQTLADAERRFREIYETRSPLMRFLEDIHAPIPTAFTTAVSFILNGDLKRAVTKDDLDVERIIEMLAETIRWGVKLELPGLNYKLTQTTDRLAADWELTSGDSEKLERLTRGVTLADDTVLDVNLWNAQNSCYRVLRKSTGGEAAEWREKVNKLAELLGVET